MTTDDQCFLVEALAPLCAPLHEAIQDGFEMADRYFLEHNFVTSGYEWFRAHLVRAHSLRHFQEQPVAGFELAPIHRNGEFLLRRELLAVRVLRDGRTGLIPAPGPNHARRRFYMNQQLTFFGPASSMLLALWSAEPDSGDVTIRVVRPVGQWRYGSMAKLDLEFVLPNEGERLADLEFVPTDEDMEVLIPMERELGDDAGTTAG